MRVPVPYLIGGGIVAAALLWATSQGARNAGAAIGGVAVDMVDGVFTGAVVGVGSVFGVPVTTMNECERAKAEGRSWDASFACPAKDFLNYVFN